mmetsp:Transcript_6000/g.14379  ORF Transcript_6000/g.14379 Transcript_6000/m.14379 type:complete len:261 (+) Transcript_6000:493-1275(+)
MVTKPHSLSGSEYGHHAREHWAHRVVAEWTEGTGQRHSAAHHEVERVVEHKRLGILEIENTECHQEAAGCERPHGEGPCGAVMGVDPLERADDAVRVHGEQQPYRRHHHKQPRHGRLQDVPAVVIPEELDVLRVVGPGGVDEPGAGALAGEHPAPGEQGDARQLVVPPRVEIQRRQEHRRDEQQIAPVVCLNPLVVARLDGVVLRSGHKAAIDVPVVKGQHARHQQQRDEQARTRHPADDMVALRLWDGLAHEDGLVPHG